MQKRTRCKQHPRTGSLAPGEGRARVSADGGLANPAALMTIPMLQKEQTGNRMVFGCSDLAALACSLVELDTASDADWIAANRVPSAMVDRVLRRFLQDRGQKTIAEHFELYLTLSESITDTNYSEPGTDSGEQLFFILNTGASFPMALAAPIEAFEAFRSGMGAALYDTLRHALYRWVRVYDEADARYRIEQMVEWAEGEDDPDDYEIPKLEQDLPECLRTRTPSESGLPLDAYPMPTEPWLAELYQKTIELRRVSESSERLKLDEGWLEYQRSYHSLDFPLPSILLYFRPGDAVMACFDDECEQWGQETPEPNLIIPFRPNDPTSVRQALAVVETLLRLLVVTAEISKLIEAQEKTACSSASMSEANLS
jgi:hypothetical protein